MIGEGHVRDGLKPSFEPIAPLYRNNIKVFREIRHVTVYQPLLVPVYMDKIVMFVRELSRMQKMCLNDINAQVRKASFESL